MMDVQTVMYVVTAIAGLITVISGARVLHLLFQGDAVSDAFSDSHHEVYMLILFGYSLFALGEICWTLIFMQQGKDVLYSAMPDFYWMVGGILILLGVTYGAFRVVSDSKKSSSYAPLVFIGVVASGALMYFISPLLGLGASDTGSSYALIYPAISFATVIASGILYYFANDEYYKLLKPLLFISMAFFVGDVLFAMLGDAYGTLGVASDLLYVGAYLATAVMFFHKHKAISD